MIMGGRKYSKEVKAEMTKELKHKKAHLYDLEKLVFLKDEPAYKLRENMRAEIMRLEKELK